MTQPKSDSSAGATKPWWQYRMVWLIIGGPLVVVIASFVTLGLALRHPDPVIESTATAVQDGAHVPALQGRNHAATGGVKGDGK